MTYAVMAVEDFPTQSTEQSTQSTQSGSQDRPITDTEIWGSLIPFNHHNPHVSRIDFERGNKIYKIGRSRRAGVNDLPFPYAGKMSKWKTEHRHQTQVRLRVHRSETLHHRVGWRTDIHVRSHSKGSGLIKWHLCE